MAKYYLYRHVTPNYDRVLYVGIGTKVNKNTRTWKQEYSRAYHTQNRNNYWNNATNKFGYLVEIMLESDDYNFIKQKEIEFISKWKSMITNMTNGGEGTKGRKWTDEMRGKISKYQIGNRNNNSRKVHNIKTGKIYGSIKEASEESRYTYNSLMDMLSGKRQNRSDIRYIGDHSSSPPRINKFKIKCLKTGLIFNSQTEAAIFFKVTPSTISNIIKGKYSSRKNINIKRYES